MRFHALAIAVELTFFDSMAYLQGDKAALQTNSYNDEDVIHSNFSRLVELHCGLGVRLVKL